MKMEKDEAIAKFGLDEKAVEHMKRVADYVMSIKKFASELSPDAATKLSGEMYACGDGHQQIEVLEGLCGALAMFVAHSLEDPHAVKGFPDKQAFRDALVSHVVGHIVGFTEWMEDKDKPKVEGHHIMEGVKI
jgi:hypothetical protein